MAEIPYIQDKQDGDQVRSILNDTITEANKVSGLEENQITGVESYLLYSDLPQPGTLKVSYKVTNDTSLLNGYYSWNGTDYVKNGSTETGQSILDLQNSKSDSIFKINVDSSDILYSEMIKIKESVSSLILKGTIDLDNFYYSLAVVKNNSTSRILRIYKEGISSGSQTEICRLEINQTVDREETERILIPEYNNSGNYAIINIDWAGLIDVDYDSLFADKWIMSNKSFKSTFDNLGNFNKSNKIDKPFELLNVTDESKAVSAAISGIYLKGTKNENSIYYLGVYTNDVGTRRLRLFEWDGVTSTEICNLTVLQTEIYTKSEIVKIPEYSNSGYFAYIAVDWGLLQGVSYLGTTLNYEVWKFSETAFNAKYFVYEELIPKIKDSEQGYFATTTPSDEQQENIDHIKKGLLSIWLNGAIDENKTYSVVVFSNSTSSRRIRIFETDAGTPTEICNLTINQSTPYTIIETVDVPEFNSSGFSAKALVDWSKVQDVNYQSLYENVWTLSEKCFSEANFKYDIQNKENIDNVLTPEKKTENLINGTDKLSLIGWTYSNGIVQSQNTGWDNFAFYNVNLNEDKFTLAVKLKDISGGDFEMGIGKRASISGTAVTLAKEGLNSYVKFYQLSDASNPTESTGTKQTLPFDLSSNRDYMLSIAKNVNDFTVNVISDIGEEFEFTTNTPAIGSKWGYPSIWSIVGQCEASEFDYSMPYVQNRDPKLLIFGDSFIEGNSITADKDKRYAALLADDLDIEQTLLLGKGGETTTSLLGRFYQQVDWYEDAKYCLLAIGTNDTVFATYQTNINLMVAYLKSKNIIPILVTVTYRGDSDNSAFITQTNPWVRSLGERFIDMSLAVTETGDETSWRAGFQLGDLVHPSIIGHDYMYRRILFDSQFLLK